MTIHRREFLKIAGAVTAAGALPRLTSADEPRVHGTADTVILLWMAGGMASTETFDPKRYAPFEVGLPAERILSTFPSIPTVVDGVEISAGLEHIAQVLDRGTLVRSHVVPDLGHILHSRHQYHWHTGYVPPQTVAAPHMGAWIAKLLGPRHEAIPAFIDVGQRLEGIGEQEELKAFHTPGFLGAEHGPFVLPYPDRAIESLRPPEGMTPARFENRQRFYRRLVESSRAAPHARTSGGIGHAFDRERLPPAALSRGPRVRPVTRAEAGLRRLRHRAVRPRMPARAAPYRSRARFIEVTTEYVPFESWDTHENGHTTAQRMKQQIDRPVAQLILDLEERGLLDRTLVVLASEFSRDMMTEGRPGSTARDQSRAPADVMAEVRQYGMHRHFTLNGSALLFGGGMKRGYVHGVTADERPCVVTKDPVSVMDLHATIYSVLGISPQTSHEIEQRPFYITEDGKGRAVEALFGSA